MYTGKTVFAQLLEHLPQHQFRQCVKRYQGNHKVRSFSCLYSIYNRTLVTDGYEIRSGSRRGFFYAMHRLGHAASRVLQSQPRH
ncbi:DUF4372 domain-containing protein [Pelodictyon luteolum]|uniref:DUF4372 domain-containing protein n=1 Tax=Pelodictyon luteolum TaxID=1100 RepID=UPI003B839085